MSFFHVVLVGIIIGGIATAGWIFTPRGKDQTCVSSARPLSWLREMAKAHIQADPNEHRPHAHLLLPYVSFSETPPYS